MRRCPCRPAVVVWVWVGVAELVLLGLLLLGLLPAGGRTGTAAAMGRPEYGSSFIFIEAGAGFEVEAGIS